MPTPQPLAQFDRDRNGIFVHIDQLDKNGISIPRSRRIDILLGGIFQQFEIDLQQQDAGAIVIRPLPEDIPR